MTEYIENILITALDSGISEFDFWEMTIAEVARAVESRNRLYKAQMQEKASLDYIQAQLIIKGVGMCLGSKEKFPSIYEAYPTLFDDIQKENEEKQAAQKAELSALRFKQFAKAFNKRYENKGAKSEK